LAVHWALLLLALPLLLLGAVLQSKVQRLLLLLLLLLARKHPPHNPPQVADLPQTLVAMQLLLRRAAAGPMLPTVYCWLES
jgi:hypothetical protein